MDINYICSSTCSIDDNYDIYLFKCQYNMEVININFIGSNINPISLNQINRNIFDKKINEGK